MSNVDKVKLLSEPTSGAPPVIFTRHGLGSGTQGLGKLLVPLLIFSVSPAFIVEVSFDNKAAIFEIFLFFHISQRFASFEILQAGWGADFATRFVPPTFWPPNFGGTKVTLVGSLSSRSLY